MSFSQAYSPSDYLFFPNGTPHQSTLAMVDMASMASPISADAMPKGPLDLLCIALSEGSACLEIFFAHLLNVLNAL